MSMKLIRGFYMTFELYLLSFGLVALCALFVGLFLDAFYRGRYVKALALKGVASLAFLGLGVITCLVGNGGREAVLVFVGLCLGVVGDEVIALCQVFPERDSLAFIGGGSFFLVGHIFYIVALFSVAAVSIPAIAVYFAIAVALSLLYNKMRGFLVGEMKIPLALYLGIVTFVGALAFGLFVKRLSIGAAIFTLGGILFTVSDNILFAYKLGKKPLFRQNIALHVAYYLAQILIAWSVLWI